MSDSANPWIAARQVSLSIIKSRSLLKLVHWVGDAIQSSCPLSSPFSAAFNLSQDQGLCKWVISSHQVAKVLEFQLQHQSFLWIFRTDFLSDQIRSVAQSCLTLCDPMDYSPSGSSVHGILQVRILEWVAGGGLWFPKSKHWESWGTWKIEGVLKLNFFSFLILLRVVSWPPSCYVSEFLKFSKLKEQNSGKLLLFTS